MRFTRVGLPCRVTTRKRAVAERALGASPVLAADEGARAQRRAAAATNLDAAQRAIVPFDFDSFKASTPAAPRERGRNDLDNLVPRRARRPADRRALRVCRRGRALRFVCKFVLCFLSGTLSLSTRNGWRRRRVPRPLPLPLPPVRPD